MLVDGINILKKPFVDALVLHCSPIADIKGVLLFGSCITEHCRVESDVDFIIIADNNTMCDEEYCTVLNNAISESFKCFNTDFDFLEARSVEQLISEKTVFSKHLLEDGYKYIKIRS